VRHRAARWAFGEFVLDLGPRELRREQEAVHLSPKAMGLLEALLERRPEALSKKELQERLWPATFVVEANVTNLVAELRAAVGDNARKPRLIRTVHGFGYAFCGQAVDRTSAEDDRVRYYLLLGTRRLDLGEGENLLGRTEDSILGLATVTISRRHACIRIAGDEAVLEDLGSKNGTYLSGERVKEPTRLKDGDEIRVGSALLTFRRVSASVSTKTQAPTSG